MSRLVRTNIGARIERRAKTMKIDVRDHQLNSVATGRVTIWLHYCSRFTEGPFTVWLAAIAGENTYPEQNHLDPRMHSKIPQTRMSLRSVLVRFRCVDLRPRQNDDCSDNFICFRVMVCLLEEGRPAIRLAGISMKVARHPAVQVVEL